MGWKKILFRRQSYPDNYIDPDFFLKELRTNLHTPVYSVQEVISSSQLIVRPFTLVCLFVCIYFYLSERWMNPFTIFAISGLIFIFSVSNNDAVGDHLSAYMFLHIFLIGVAPILCTLTQSISDDTLWAMTVIMLFFHLIFYTYKQEQMLLYNALSLNAVMFTTVCLASMLNSAWNAFVLVSISIHLFAFGPKFTTHLIRTNAILVVFTTTLLMTISFTLAIAFVVITISTAFVFPLWLYMLQDLKNNIYGPWDEVII